MEIKRYPNTPDCVINDYFENANERVWHQNEYCERFCKFRCLNGRYYKKRRSIEEEVQNENNIER